MAKDCSGGRTRPAAWAGNHGQQGRPTRPETNAGGRTHFWYICGSVHVTPRGSVEENGHTHPGIRTAHKVAVHDCLPHLGRDEERLHAVAASDLVRDEARKVFDAHVLHEGPRGPGDFVSSLQALYLMIELRG